MLTEILVKETVNPTAKRLYGQANFIFILFF